MDNKYCNSCNSCDSCNYCDYCNFCGYCDYCDSCDFCDSCKNLVNGFMCINLKFDKKDKAKYWIFNKEVSKAEWIKRFDIGKQKICSECGKPLEQNG